MAKEKIKGAKSGPGKHLQARIAYLHRAAGYLSQYTHQVSEPTTSVASTTAALVDEARSGARSKSMIEPKSLATCLGKTAKPSEQGSDLPIDLPLSGGLPLLLLAHLRTVAQKTTSRLPQEVKHSICKRCDSLLIEGSTSSKRIENASNGGRKACADVLVAECRVCGTMKRWPVGAKRQKKKGARVIAEGVPKRTDQFGFQPEAQAQSYARNIEAGMSAFVNTAGTV